MRISHIADIEKPRDITDDFLDEAESQSCY